VPDALDAAGLVWSSTTVPGTAASSVRSARDRSVEPVRDFDSDDWWYRCTLTAPSTDSHEVLRFEGLATIADVWIDGEHRLRANNMFSEHEIPLARRAGTASKIDIRFRSLTKALELRRPRPRWRSQIVAQQQLRWFRTTLLGRIAAWSPPVAPVGPWRPVTRESRSRLTVDSADVRPRVERDDGIVEASLRLRAMDGALIEGASIEVGVHRERLEVERGADGVVSARGTARVPSVARWWPHTHGAQPLYRTRVIAHTSRGDVCVDLGNTGFRSLDVERTHGGFTVRVNGVEVFCRGACWTPLDIRTLGATDEEYRSALLTCRAAGMNTIRVGGTMIYESDAFFELADELGILIWHDFMFANMDYPIADPDFAASIRTEATQFLSRVQLCPSVAVMCGGSEVEQQAAMMGMPSTEWTSALFTDLLPSIVKELRPDVAYVPSTPTGGSLPFQIDVGVSHYYGVGAYLRPLDDARRARVRFTSECLAFANVPRDETIEAFMADGQAAPNHPAWKSRVPRDKGAGWDFDDVRDHYVEQLFGVDAAMLRYADVPRYLALGRVATGELMSACMAEWRRRGSSCDGALVWFLQDLWPGAGWGVLDSFGRPKAAYYFLKRALQPIGLFAIDEGLNGLALHAINETAHAIDAELRVALYRDGDVRVADGSTQLRIPARGAVETDAAEVLGRFVDVTYAYRFGPPPHDVTVAALVERASGRVLADTIHLPGSLPRVVSRPGDLGLEGHAVAVGVDAWQIVVRSRAFAYAVAVDARGFDADDDFFHVAPGGERTFTLRARTSGATPSATLRPLNGSSSTKIAFPAKP
jgi:beta-mannosidase